jgi:hypothetical protein
MAEPLLISAVTDGPINKILDLLARLFTHLSREGAVSIFRFFSFA